MLRSTNDRLGYAIQAGDGTIGHVKDFYMDDAAWAIRYLVVDAGNWLSSRKVLVSPMAITQPNWSEQSPASAQLQRSRGLPHSCKRW